MRMPKLLLVAVLLLPAIGRSEPPSTVPAEFVSHTMRSGMTLSIPPRWRDVTPAAQENLQAGFVDETGRQSLAVSVGPAASDVTVEACVRTLPPALKASVAGFRLISVDVVKLEGPPACRIVYERAERGLVARQCEWLMVANGFEYLLLYTARASEFDANLPTAVAVAQSIRIPTTPPLTVADFFTCKPPAGFVVEHVANSRLVDCFVERSATGAITRTIQIDGGLAKLPSAQAIAASLAGGDGRVDAQPANVDGTDGVRFTSTATMIEKPRAGVIVLRNGRVFMLVATSTGADVTAALEAAIKSWHWTRPAD